MSSISVTTISIHVSVISIWPIVDVYKNNKEFVDESGYLFYNVTTLDPFIHTSDKVFNCEMMESKPFRGDFHSYKFSLAFYYAENTGSKNKHRTTQLANLFYKFPRVKFVYLSNGPFKISPNL